MSPPSALPPALVDLFPAGTAADRTASTLLPPGRLISGDEGDDVDPALWVSDGPVTAGSWRSWYAEQERSGLYPLLLDTLSNEPRRPWDDGELWPDPSSSPDDHDASELLARWWADRTAPGDAEPSAAVTEPYGRQWPGLAEPRRAPVDPDEEAGRCAEELVRSDPSLRLGLIAAGRGSDALDVAGWQGASNYHATAELAAVLRSWEDRFGVRVVGAGFADLYLSVAAPPTDQRAALHVAAEHFAVCPDNVWQGVTPLDSYARGLVDCPLWSFWWD